MNSTTNKLQVEVSNSKTSGYVVVVCGSGKFFNGFENDSLVFYFYPKGFFDSAKTVEIDGVVGLNEWNIENVGDCISEEELLDIRALIEGMAETMFYHNYGLD